MFGPDFLQQMAKMKEATDKGMEKLKDCYVEGNGGTGLVRIKMDGNFRLVHLEIATDHRMMEKEELEDFLSIALQDAIKKVNELREKELSSSIIGLM